MAMPYAAKARGLNDPANNEADFVVQPDQKNIVGRAKENAINPVSALMALRDQGANIKQLLVAMNQTFAVVKYGSKIVVAEHHW